MLASLIRTAVPAIVGALLSIPVVAAAGITEAQATTVVLVAVQLAYYLAARVAERYVSPRFGWLLGLPRTPSYANDKTVAGDVVPPSGGPGL